jgi:hypothetical protein
MGRLTKAATDKATVAVRKTASRVREKAAEVETRLLVEEGRRSVRAKKATVTKVTKKALRAGLVTGAATVAAVVMHEVRKRRGQ